MMIYKDLQRINLLLHPAICHLSLIFMARQGLLVFERVLVSIKVGKLETSNFPQQTINILHFSKISKMLP